MIATIYVIRTSTLSVQISLADALQEQAGTMISGEVGIGENRLNGRAIGQALYVRWSADIV